MILECIDVTGNHPRTSKRNSHYPYRKWVYLGQKQDLYFYSTISIIRILDQKLMLMDNHGSHRCPLGFISVANEKSLPPPLSIPITPHTLYAKPLDGGEFFRFFFKP